MALNPAFTNGNMTRPQRALMAAQRIVRNRAAYQAEQILSDLELFPAVSYVVEYANTYNFFPRLDIAVRLVDDLYWGGRVKDGRLSLRADIEAFTDERVAAAKELAEMCIAALQETGEPYAIITHVHGDEVAEFHYGRQTAAEAIQGLRYALGDALMYAC